ncbi:carbohydrate kinase family protein [Alteromonas halophila]|uniref:Fructokinase n=1 Tax=Alteromonas halophila TaxID=516698 RepID=A0A918MZ00_9ALTE|nr:carbohydrate kinase [Alteromonas halophila]GGW83465.1 fructokinase [Alteromonas halophila]
MKVISVGEVLIDMLAQRDSIAGTPPMMSPFQPHAGGAPANVAVAVAKLGGQSSMISRVGSDVFGDYLISMLRHYQVGVEAVVQLEVAKTALAFVSLDKDGERSFDFYLENAAHTWLDKAAFADVVIQDDDIVHFCSGSLATPRLREGTALLLDKVGKAGALSSLDINFRPAFWASLDDAPGMIDNVASQVSIIKASQEELDALYGQNKTTQCIKHWLDSGVKLILLTDGGKAVRCYTANGQVSVTPPDASVKDTTAAGDSFIGGLLYSVTRQLKDAGGFDEWVSNPAALEAAVSFAARCGAHTVSQYGAFTALPSARDVSD